VDVALGETPLAPPRDLTYCRFPLVDGAGNPAWLLRGAAQTAAGFLRSGTPTLVCCSAGMSRAPAVAAMALAIATGRPPEECLREVAGGDVSPALWRELTASSGSVAPPSAP
jgi:protein-tyrosine phosphatase